MYFLHESGGDVRVLQISSKMNSPVREPFIFALLRVTPGNISIPEYLICSACFARIELLDFP